MVNSGADIVINAGDFHPDKSTRMVWESGITPSVRYLSVLGNHDFYYAKLNDCHWSTMTKKNLKIVGTTLWTDFKRGDPLVMLDFDHYMYDAKAIKYDGIGRLADKLLCLHKFQLNYIAEKKPDIVVTHHSPSLHSVPSEFHSHGFANYFFCSELDQFILENPNIKLWIYGHNHAFADYMVGSTRVVCNPLGYPSEWPDVATYKPLMIEV